MVISGLLWAALPCPPIPTPTPTCERPAQHCAQTSTWIQVAAQALVLVIAWVLDRNTDPGSGRTMDPDMALSGSPGSDIIMASGNCAGSSYCWILTIVSSPVPPFSTVHELLHFSLSPTSLPHTLSHLSSTFVHHIGTCHQGPWGKGGCVCVFWPLWAVGPGHVLSNHEFK